MMSLSWSCKDLEEGCSKTKTSEVEDPELEPSVAHWWERKRPVWLEHRDQGVWEGLTEVDTEVQARPDNLALRDNLSIF